jgi:hypothetical protein
MLRSRGQNASLGVSVLGVSKIPSEPEMMMTGEDVQGARRDYLSGNYCLPGHYLDQGY